jgi:hypothetical protein
MSASEPHRNITDLQRLAKREDRIARGLKAPNRLERIREWYASGETLTEEDEVWRLMMEEAYELLLEGKSKSQIAIHISETKDVDNRVAFEVIGNCLDLFGSLNRGSKAGMRAVITDRMLRLASLAEEKNELDLSRKILNMVSDINNLKQDDEKVKERRRVNIFRYSTDATVLKQIEEETYE